MKRMLMIVALIGFMASPVWASNHTKTIQMQASVGEQLVLTANLFEKDILPANDIPDTTMNFGTLVPEDPANPGSPLRADTYFQVLLTSNSSSRPYTVSQNGTQLKISGTSTALPDAALKVNTHANGATLSGTLSNTSPVSWVNSNLLLFTSNAAGKLETFAAAYAIPSGVPADQTSGTYTGQVIFTLATT